MKRDVLDDLIDTCKSCLVVAKVELLKVVILLVQNPQRLKRAIHT